MSTRIYNGFLMKTDSLSQIMASVNEFRPWVVHEAEKKMDVFLSRLYASGMSVGDAHRTWSARRDTVRITKLRDPAVDTDFALSIMPEPPGGHCLGICYTENSAWLRAWLKRPDVEEYGYWDNTDKLSRVTTAAWRTRRDAWAAALPLGEPVVMHSLSIDLMGPHHPWPKAARPKKGKNNEGS